VASHSCTLSSRGLGVTCLWLAPLQKSPRRDDGYDISDHFQVDPCFGTLGDFVDFTQQASQRGIRVMIDLVVNHTSDQHPWFQEARRDPRSKYRDYYVRSDTRPENHDEGMVFPGVQKTTWTRDPVANQYYFHRLYEFQPDLNTENPLVLAEIRKIMGFYLELGVCGFRLGPEKSMQLYGRGIRRRLAPMLHGESPAAGAGLQPAVHAAGDAGDPLRRRARHGRRPRAAAAQLRPHADAVVHRGTRRLHPRQADPAGDRAGALRLQQGQCGGPAPRPRLAAELDGRIIRMRKEVPEIGWGDFKVLDTGNDGVLALRYDWRNNAVVVIHNLQDEAAEIQLRVGGLGYLLDRASE